MRAFLEPRKEGIKRVLEATVNILPSACHNDCWWEADVNLNYLRSMQPLSYRSENPSLSISEIDHLR
jgi:hypothetical protein